ncbi:MAG: hypothetical protein A3C06_01860 [Candidatus Taylorbacteria bacterium RIFCSPHIGHO2_02_FULL_46_13]|uniref:Peptidase M14 domain-containing protein n=1 Tax=Candidatus Taylorbacteria bacterium RIFCSPHIGHO2_02_FULL_46_13 TaxID=1802312 RepID=A0A1G2MRV0_9BACT|nr:MAG: hypothetical protein A3C06_01860 [Candidatus Taylorbacteria bacterium RIFCSPHIGHO2_02_FULL_46_13]
MKKIIVIVVVIILVAVGFYFLTRNSSNTPANDTQTTTTGTSSQNADATQTQKNAPQTVIGTSSEGRDITAYHFGTGNTNLLFVGGIHGGYEWNTALVAYQLINYLKENPDAVPANVRVTVIPVLNPDGLNKVVGTTTGNFTKANVSTLQDTVISGRFNGNTVDLNRNFDCDWQSTGTWQNKTVSGGSAAFSELESQAIKNYVETNKPTAVVVWYSAAGGVYSSNCHNGVSAETTVITKKFADASGYPAYESFDFYTTTGDMTNWLAKGNITAISVLLTNHTDTEWTKNLAGIQALLTYYRK